MPTQEERDQRIIDHVRAKYDDAFFTADHPGEQEFKTCDNDHPPAEVPLIWVGAMVGVLKVGKCPQCGRLAVVVDEWARSRLIWETPAALAGDA